MYLKSLEIQGFKSFANKTLFQFHEGITGVVGPNGSGKSNVSDAIRWVLGEQSAKSLRGGSMQDVIFAGTQTRKPLSFAYVAITFDNADHLLPVDYDEVTVARRLYRSGESEYMINGTAVRMRDIQELFYDTGIGKEGYSLIGQGQVEQILNGKPEERRELFDEAAGIVKYKHRKTSALKKLEDEQKNLVRVSDILSELDRQVGPLKKQSETARIYLQKRDELKKYDVNLFLLNNDTYQTSLTGNQKRYDDAKSEQEEAQKELERAKAQYEQLSEELTQLEGQVSSVTDEETEEKLSRQQTAGQIDLLEDQMEALLRSDEELKGRRQKLQTETESRKQQLENARARAQELEKLGQELHRKRAAEEEQHRDLQSQDSVLSGKIEARKAEVLRILSGRSDIQSGQQRADTMLEQLSLREAELAQREITLRSDEKEQNTAKTSLREKKQDAQQQAQSLQERSEQLSKQLESAQSSFTEKSAQLETLTSEYTRDQARFDTLHAMTERYEGYGGAIRRVMEQKEKNPGILGVVADLIQTSKKYELAIETALGGSIQNIVTEDEATAKRMIGFLKENRFGRATFLPLTAMKAFSFSQRDALNERGVIGLASDLVKCEEKFRDLSSHLLGRTLVVDNLDNAAAIARRYRYSLRIVTLDGELLSPGGSMTGGAFKSSSNLLGRRREIDEMTKTLQKKKTRLDALSREVSQVHTLRNQLRDEITAVSGQIQKNRYDLSMLQSQMKDMDVQIGKTQDAFAQIAQERDRIRAQKKLLQSESSEKGASLKKSDEAEKAANAEIEVLQRQLEELREKARGSEEKLSAMKLEETRQQQEGAFISQNQTRLAEEMDIRARESLEIEEQLKDHERSRLEKKDQEEKLRGQIEESKGREAALSAKLQALAEEKEKKESIRKSFFAKREELSERSSLLDREIYRLQQQIEKIKEDQEKAIAYLWEEYELTPIACRQLRQDDLGSVTAIRKQIGTLRHDIKQLGNVNVNAIEEYKEISERHEFLTAQHEDLVKSANDLQKIIEELDEGMRTRFKEQFVRIQTEFDHTFRELFGGGKGTLELEENEDILDAGIRVIAQPPGKKLQNMMQLSGGEKSLTAIALLFAIQNLKPSPFCLLDEIESALDENNVDRYAQYLHKLTKHTQFIIITHRRGSMTAADRLYGITMQEKGVSALVSVDLVEDKLDD